MCEIFAMLSGSFVRTDKMECGVSEFLKTDSVEHMGWRSAR
jgi:hypothetical protein